jgi:ribokinase
VKVLVVGDVMLDVVVRPVGLRAPTSDTPSRVHLGRGGSGANLAVALARAGHSVTYVGAVGHDSAGATWRDDLAASAVRASLEDVDAPTGVVVALVDETGQRAMFTDRGANRLLSREFVFRALAGRADHLHVSGYSVLDDATREVAVAALARAHERAMTTSVDVCSVGPLETLGADVFAEAIGGVDYLFANEEEARVLGGEDLDEALLRLRVLAREGMVTRGPSGALAWIGDEVVTTTSAASDVLDTTGAGDAASGTYLGARLFGETPVAALEAAMEAAAEVVRSLGAG